MTVAELLIILAHVDPALEVTVHAPHGLWHVDTVARSARRAEPLVHSGKVPPLVRLNGGTMVSLVQRGALWYDPAPPFELHGSYLNRAHLDEQLGRR